MTVEQSVKQMGTSWRPLASLREWARRRAAEREHAAEDAQTAGEIRWRWREATIGAGLGELVYTPSGATMSVPLVTRVDLRPVTSLTVRLRPGQLAGDIVAAQERLADLMGMRWIRVTPRAPGLVTVELW